MSRLPKDEVWMRYYGDSHNALCPVCENSQMIRNSTYSSNWNTTMIIGSKRGGPDNWANVRPVCTPCHKAIKQNGSVFIYLAVKQKIDPTQASNMEAEFKQYLANYCLNIQCINILRTNQRCKSNKCAFSEHYCKTCYNQMGEVVPMEID